MIISEILIGVLGNGAYDILKQIFIKIFNEPDENRDSKLIQSFNRAVNRFFEQYGDQFGTPSSSFFSIERNWTLICNSIFYGAEEIIVDDFCIEGLGIDKVNVKHAIRDFLTMLKEEMHKDRELDKILTEKKHIREAKETKAMVEEILRITKEYSRDIDIGSIIERLREEFTDSIISSLISGTPIHRKETDDCLNAIKENRSIILNGSAGYGKSGVLYELSLKLTEEGIIWLPLRLDRRTPEKTSVQYGNEMGLPGSPVTCLVKYAGKNKCVLILDQLDAIRWTGRHSANALDVCKELIREILFLQNTGKNVSVILACRTFDLENDPEIKTWLNSEKTRDFIKIPVGIFPEQDVRNVVGDVYNEMTDRQKNILSNPQNLSIWFELSKNKKLPFFRSATELMRMFWKYRRSQLESLNITSEDINKVIECLVDWLEKNGKISAPNRIISHCSVTAIKGFKSFGIIQEQNNKVAFCHQSYLDYLIAERLVAEIDNGRSIVTWLGAKEKQTLFRREQLRQALAMLMEESSTKFITIVKEILLNEGIRFHLKHLVLELIGQMEEEISSIAEFLTSLLKDKYWESHVTETIFYGHVPFVKYLIDKGIIKDWLDSDNEENINRGLWLLRSIVEKTPDEVTQILEPYIGKGSNWPNKILNTICWKLTDDSDNMFELRLRLIRIGVISEFIDWKKLCEKYPLRALRLINEVIPTLEIEEDDDWNIKKKPRHEELNTEELVALYSAALIHPEETWVLFVPHIERLALIRNSESIEWKIQSDWLDKRSSGIWRAVVELLIKSGGKLAQENPDRLLQLSEQLNRSNSKIAQSIIIEVYAHLPDKFSEIAINWLLEDPLRFKLGDRHLENKWSPARRLIETQSPYCSDKLFIKLENIILNYHDPDEIKLAKYYLKGWKEGYFGHYWGEAQYFLLPALAKERISQKSIDLIKILNRKFGNYFDRPNHSGGWIGSKLDKNLYRISNNSWLSIVSNKKVPFEHNKWEQVNVEYAVESSVRQFYRSLRRIAKQFPERFGKLSLSFPEDVHPYYIAAIFDALALNKPDSDIPEENKKSWTPAAINTIYAVVKKFINFENKESVQAYCRLISERSSELWPNEALNKLIELAINHPDPNLGELNVSTPGKSIEEESNDILFQNTINCVRGVAASTIGHLLWDHPDLFDKLRLGIESLVKDPHPVVRMAVIEALIPILKINNDLAVKWFVEATSGDERISASHFAMNFFKYTMPKYYEDLGTVIRGMVNSINIEVSKHGSQLVTAYYLFYGLFKEEFEICLSGTTPQRVGVAEVAADIICNEEHSQRCQEILTKLIEDPEEQVRRAVSRMFRHKEFNLAENVSLAIQFAYSKGFAENSYSLINCIEESKESLLPFSEIIFEICKAISTEFVEETRSIQYKMGFVLSEIAPLLLRLYEQTQETRPDIADKCLDAWDILYERRVGQVRELTKEIEK